MWGDVKVPTRDLALPYLAPHAQISSPCLCPIIFIPSLPSLFRTPPGVRAGMTAQMPKPEHCFQSPRVLPSVFTAASSRSSIVGLLALFCVLPFCGAAHYLVSLCWHPSLLVLLVGTPPQLTAPVTLPLYFLTHRNCPIGAGAGKRAGLALSSRVH